jgi:hypothetical protein
MRNKLIKNNTKDLEASPKEMIIKQRTTVQDTYVCMLYMNRAMSGISICKGVNGRRKENGQKRGGKEH